MIKILIIVYIISFYLSLPGFFSKAGYNSLSGLIPIYNLYILFQILEIKPIIVIKYINYIYSFYVSRCLW